MSQTFQQGFRDYCLFISGALAEVGVDSIKRLSEEVAEDLQADYDSFFVELYGLLASRPTSTPSRLLGNLGGEAPWRPLSNSWNQRKKTSRNGDVFYHGLTDQIYKAKMASREKRKRGAKGRAPTKGVSFLDMLKRKADSSPAQVKKLFGPLSITYSIEGKGRKTAIRVDQKNNAIQQIGAITAQDSKGRFIPKLGNITLTANIMAFPYLQKVQSFSEWYVVDYLARNDAGNRAQWRKVNSRVTPDGGIRPMRAIITPLISWYLTTKFKQNFRGRFL